MGKTYRGNPPQGKHWSPMGSCKDGDGLNWIIFIGTQQRSEEWVTYKIIASGRATNKANYWFTRNLKTGRMGLSRDLHHMQNYRPDLYAQVVAILGK